MHFWICNCEKLFFDKTASILGECQKRTCFTFSLSMKYTHFRLLSENEYSINRFSVGPSIISCSSAKKKNGPWRKKRKKREYLLNLNRFKGSFHVDAHILYHILQRSEKSEKFMKYSFSYEEHFFPNKMLWIWLDSLEYFKCFQNSKKSNCKTLFYILMNWLISAWFVFRTVLASYCRIGTLY